MRWCLIERGVYGGCGCTFRGFIPLSLGEGFRGGRFLGGFLLGRGVLPAFDSDHMPKGIHRSEVQEVLGVCTVRVFKGEGEGGGST